MFSLIIFQVATREMQSKMESIQTSLENQSDNLNLANIGTLSSSESKLSLQLLYLNVFVLVVGGLGSYLLAKRSLRPIQKSHEAQSRFTSDASHELRTPLAVMKTEIEVALRDKDASKKNLKEVLSSNLEEVNKLSKLADMLLSISRLESGEIQLSPVKLEKVLKSVVKEFNNLDRNFTISVKSKPTIIANETAITDLIRILIDNAVNYSPNKSTIDIELSADEEFARLSITNVGQGIEPSKIPYIFERFYRADSSRTNGAHKGYGLGLALAKNIVNIHHGEIIATSTPGEETTFVTLLPIKSNQNDED